MMPILQIEVVFQHEASVRRLTELQSAIAEFRDTMEMWGGVVTRAQLTATPQRPQPAADGTPEAE